MNRLLLTDEQSLHSRFVAELAIRQGGIEAWRELSKAAQFPLDLRLVESAIRGAYQAFHTACTFLEEPNSKADAVALQLQLLFDAVQHVQAGASEEDATSGLIRTLSSFPAWRLLAEAGSSEFDGAAFQFIVGVELAVSIAKNNPIAQAFSVALRRDKVNLVHQPALLLESIYDDTEPLRTPWTTRLKLQLGTFRTLFEGGKPRPLPTRSLNERFGSQWSAKAAYPTFAARAGVVDDRCLSAHQYRTAFEKPHGGLEDQYKVAMFFVGICGFTPTIVAEIPIGVSLSTPPICYLDFSTENCLLIRDFEQLAYDQASPQGIDGQPATLVLSTPLPRDIGQYLLDRKRATPCAKRLGDLVPLLTQILSEDALYPNLEEMKPTWAKLRPSMGRLLRQQGHDSFLTALLTADFALTAKSKLYYATVSANEWWRFAAEAYETLGFEAPLPLEGPVLAFGSKVTPTAKQLCEANHALTEECERARPGRKASTQDLLAFHTAFTRLLAFKTMVLLALRESGHVPLPAPNDFPVIYLIEKSSAGRRGGMATPIPAHLAQQVKLYVTHCKALLARMPGTTPKAFREWLQQVVSGESDLALCICSIRGQAIPMSTRKVLDAPAIRTRFASDLGRKFLENELRRRKVRTEDIDRVLRHDVAGQGGMKGTSDGSEAAWARRICPTLDQIADDLRFGLMRGLGGGAK